MSRLLIDAPNLIGWCLAIALLEGLVLLGPLALLRHHARRQPARVRHRLAAAAMVTLVALFPLTLWLGTGALQPRLAGVVAPASLPVPVSQLSHGAVGVFPILFAIWLTGVVVALVRLSVGAIGLRRIVRQGCASRDAEPGLENLVRRAELRRAPLLVESAQVSGPFVIGWGRGIVVIPAGFASLLTAEERDAVLLHELVHLVRHDFGWNVTQQLATALFWFHPAIWLVGEELHRVREECCDDEVVAAAGRPVELARALVHLEEIRLVETSLVLAGTGGALATRVRRLLAPAEVSAPVGPVFLGLGVMALLASTSGAAYGGRWAADLTMTGTPIVRITASDPGGPFTVEMAGGVIRSMTMNGAVVPRERLRQSGHRLQLLDAAGSTQLDLRIESRGAIHWLPRPAPSPTP